MNERPRRELETVRANAETMLATIRVISDSIVPDNDPRKYARARLDGAEWELCHTIDRLDDALRALGGPTATPAHQVRS
jgi:hypothetical protein